MFVIVLLSPFYTVQDPSLGKGRIYRKWTFPHQLSESLLTPQTWPEASSWVTKALVEWTTETTNNHRDPVSNPRLAVSEE